MDVVKLSAASGFALMAMLTAAASASGGRAVPLVAEAATASSPEQVQSRIDDAFRPAATRPPFGLTGPLFPVQSDAQAGASVAPAPTRWPPIGTPVDTWSASIDEASRRFGVPAEWVRGVMRQESGGRTHLNGRPITSPAGAMGLMQVMPGTFAEMSARHGLGSDPYDPRANILAGAAYLRAMYDRYGPAHFLAAYNAGPARVAEHLRTGRALPGETRAYTAALQPRLLPGVVSAGVTAPGNAQDLTSAPAMRDLVASSSRSRPSRSIDPAASPLIATASAIGGAAGRQRDMRSNDGLFVTLSAVDRRREASAGDRVED